MIIRSCKSTDFTDDEIMKIYNLYEIVFKEKRSKDFFYQQFMNTPLGYSYHAVAEIDGEIVGHNVYVPFYYLKGEKKFLMALSIDAMVHPYHQGKGIYSKLLKACEDLAVSEGCKIRIGFPNENSYPIQIKAFKYHDFGTMDTYCLPIRPSSVKSFFRPFDWLTKLIAKNKINSSSTNDNHDTPQYLIRRERDSFDKCRYNWYGGDYQILNAQDFKAVYKKSSFKGIDATFLIDVYPLNRNNFDLAVKYIYSQMPNTSLILYVGNLKFRPKTMFKIPKRLEPKCFHFVGKVLDKEYETPEILDINNWELNLSTFDLL